MQHLRPPRTRESIILPAHHRKRTEPILHCQHVRSEPGRHHQAQPGQRRENIHRKDTAHTTQRRQYQRGNLPHHSRRRNPLPADREVQRIGQGHLRRQPRTERRQLPHRTGNTHPPARHASRPDHQPARTRCQRSARRRTVALPRDTQGEAQRDRFQHQPPIRHQRGRTHSRQPRAEGKQQDKERLPALHPLPFRGSRQA